MKRKELTLDPRTQEDLCRRVEELAASYTPEWRFDRGDPDIGSTIALIYAGQMAENIRRMNRLGEKYHTEFVNMLGLTLKPAYPASGTVVVELLRGTVPGTALPRGTRLMKDGGDGESILFETVGDVYITNSRITDILSLSGTRGRIYPLLGDLKPAQLAPEAQETAGETPTAGGGEETPQTGAFAMFDYEDAGIEKNALLLYHRTAFGADASVPLQISVRTAEGASLAEMFCDGARWRWSYYTDAGLCPFERVELLEDTVLLHREGASVPLRVDGEDYHLVCLEALAPIDASIVIGDIRVSSRKEPSAPELILNGGEELDARRCMPLGETASLFGECYICDDQTFSQQDATVTLSFRLSSRKKLLHLTAQQESDELKVIKRKPHSIQYHTAAAAPDRIAIEYFNGQLWRRLPCESDWAAIFDGK
ncbi:MAG: hypothetical protein IJA73_00915, partial [Oscillospiraceae bacterium]|nr:hypothetical protein [Oscillospiraceae bacterium]